MKGLDPLVERRLWNVTLAFIAFALYIAAGLAWFGPYTRRENISTWIGAFFMLAMVYEIGLKIYLSGRRKTAVAAFLLPGLLLLIGSAARAIHALFY
ncbi:hypothetical protein [Pseudomonas sp. CGJS7]|uniref:hypothetical protein n=1 Tax=Pseudomonas sp. CGJS7 TaxID=3109348 RepID=UPI0030093856